MDDPVLFYEPEDEFGYLSNFAEYSINIDGESWKSTEHFYQTNKFIEPEIRNRIKDARDPAEAFRLSRKFQNHIRADWEDSKYEIMQRAIHEKFTQHPRLAFLLLNTEGNEIKEHSHKDSYWGDGGDGHGKNNLGKIIMQTRDSLAKIKPYNLVRYVDSSKLPTEWGDFTLHGFKELSNNQEHVALTLNNWDVESSVLTRLHSECLTGDAFASMRCDCGYQLRKAMELIAKQGEGLLLYLRQEGRGIGLLNKIRAYHLQDDGCDTIEANENLGLKADMRHYDFVEGMLLFLGVKKIRLLTNNPKKIDAFTGTKVEITERVPMVEGVNPHNYFYLETKARKMGHKIDISKEGRRFRPQCLS